VYTEETRTSALIVGPLAGLHDGRTPAARASSPRAASPARWMTRTTSTGVKTSMS